MKLHTSEFKNEIKELGTEIDSIITYELNGETIELGDETLNSVSPHYEGAILKSVMKQLDIDSDIEIPIGTIVNYQFGVKVRDDEVDDEVLNDYRKNYDYINFGNYIVKESEKQEDTQSYRIVCYDKMLYSMTNYEAMNITYPITIRNYINAICNHLGLTFKNANNTFANYDKVISNELFLSTDGSDIDYTFRDVLDQLAQVTASVICINEVDDKLEIRYPNETNDTIDADYLKDTNVNFGEKFGPINTIVLSRSADSDKIYYPEILPQNPIEIVISDNEIMNFNDRDTYLQDIYNKLNGLEFYTNNFESIGVGYYNLYDMYNVEVTTYDADTEESTTRTYDCIMLNDDFIVDQGIEEKINTELPTQTETDYTYADSTDQRINKTYIIAKKNEGEIEELVSVVQENVETTERLVTNMNGLTNTFTKAGGNNLLFNSGLHFTNEDGSFTYWNVEIDGDPEDPDYDKLKLDVIADSESLSGTDIILPKGKISQTINIYDYINPELYDVQPTTHNLSFSYKKNIDIANCYVTINNTRYKLGDESDWTLIEGAIQKLTLTNNVFTIEFECDIQGGYYIKEIMLNSGNEALNYSQNINETRTDTVNISDGIVVSSSSTNTISRHDSDGFRIYNKTTNEKVLKATGDGVETSSIVSLKDSEIAGLIIKKYEGHTLLSGKGD